MKYGFSIPNRGVIATPEAMVTIAQRGEALGYDALFFGDHIIVPTKIGSRYPYSVYRTVPGRRHGGSDGASDPP